MRRFTIIFISWLLIIGHLNAALRPRDPLPAAALPPSPVSSECGTRSVKSELVGLYYLRARYLNAANGRFWNADTYAGRNREPQSLHRYLYTNAEPVNGFDPSGNETLVSINVAAALAVAFEKTLIVAAVGVYSAHYLTRDYTVWGQFTTDHAFIFIRRSDADWGYRYDVALPSLRTIAETRKRPFDVFEGTIEKERVIAASVEGVSVPFAKFNDGHIPIWEAAAQLLAWDLAGPLPIGPFPTPFPYRLASSNCFDWTFGAGLGATAISLLPIPKPNGNYF